MRICLVVNPHAGRKQGLSVAERAVGLLREREIEGVLRVSTFPGHTVEIARDLDPDEWDGVVAVGGDGTVFELVNGLLSYREDTAMPVGQIPVGTGNSFIRDLGITSVEQAVENIAGLKLRRVDLGKFSYPDGAHYFINLLGAGFVSNVAYRAGRYKSLGSLSYIVGVLEEMIALKSGPVTLEIDGRVIERDCVFVEICNSRYTGGNMLMAPAADIGDGRLDVVLLNKVSRRRLLQLFPSIFNGTHVDADEVETFTGKDIRLRSEAPLALTPDGETFGNTPIEVSVHPGKLGMFGSSAAP